MTMAYDIKGPRFKVLQIIMTTNRMPTRHMVHAIIQDTIETELPSLWNNATGCENYAIVPSFSLNFSLFMQDLLS